VTSHSRPLYVVRKRELSLRDAEQLRRAYARYALRALACRITQRHRATVSLLGVLGVCGFVAAVGCLHLGLLDSEAFFTLVASSLGAFLASLVIAALGDPHELERLRARAARRLKA
jgi:hypothetical protein